jgi:HlyD family secretion protein
VERQIAQAQATLAAAQATMKQASAKLAEAQADRRDLRVLAPFDGIIATRVAEPGEVLAPGTTVVTMVDLSKVYLRGFIPEGQIGRVRVGQKARVYLDSAPTKPVEAFVSRIDPEASFTPENTYFRNDRVMQVVGVKLQVKEAIGYAKPGMPADGDVLVSGTWPASHAR